MINKSALKRERQNLAKRQENRVIKSKVHTAYKQVIEALHEKNKENVENKFRNFTSVVDKAVKKGVFHKNKGARNKSQIAKKIKVILNENQAVQ